MSIIIEAGDGMVIGGGISFKLEPFKATVIPGVSYSAWFNMVQATAFTATGGTGTITFVALPTAPYSAGDTITTSGFTPVNTTSPANLVNASFVVVSCTTTQVIFALSGTYTASVNGLINSSNSSAPKTLKFVISAVTPPVGSAITPTYSVLDNYVYAPPNEFTWLPMNNWTQNTGDGTLSVLSNSNKTVASIKGGGGGGVLWTASTNQVITLNAKIMTSFRVNQSYDPRNDGFGLVRSDVNTGVVGFDFPAYPNPNCFAVYVNTLATQMVLYNYFGGYGQPSGWIPDSTLAWEDNGNIIDILVDNTNAKQQFNYRVNGGAWSGGPLNTTGVVP